MLMKLEQPRRSRGRSDRENVFLARIQKEMSAILKRHLNRLKPIFRLKSHVIYIIWSQSFVSQAKLKMPIFQSELSNKTLSLVAILHPKNRRTGAVVFCRTSTIISLTF